MKHTITRHELAAIDQLGAASDLLNVAIETFFGLPDLSIEPIRGALVNIRQSIERQLEIAGWDQNKQDAVRQYVEGGPQYSIERLTTALGVRCDWSQ